MQPLPSGENSNTHLWSTIFFFKLKGPFTNGKEFILRYLKPHQDLKVKTTNNS